MASFDAAYFSPVFFDASAAVAVLVGPRVIISSEPGYAEDRTTQRGKPGFYKAGQLSDRYK